MIAAALFRAEQPLAGIDAPPVRKWRVFMLVPRLFQRAR